MEGKWLLHSGGKFRSRQQVLECGSKDVFPQELLGQGSDSKAVQRWCDLLWSLMMNPARSRLLGLQCLLQELLKHRKTHPTGCKERVNRLPARNGTFWVPEWGKQGRDSRIIKRGRSQGWMGDTPGCFLYVWETRICV